MSVTDDLLANARRYAAEFDKAGLALRPARRVAVLACMDARLNVYGLLGLAEGDAHVLRNAGGLATADSLRSLAISQRALGTREILVIHHTDCGMSAFDNDEFRRSIETETGIEPTWEAGALDTDIRNTLARLRTETAIPVRDSIRGFVYEVSTGELREVT